MTSTETSIAGRPINGTVQYYSEKTLPKQRPITELIPALDALFAFPEVESVRWRQSTPYFNDGEACLFSVDEPSVKFVDNGDGGDDDDGYLDEYTAEWADGYDYPHSAGRNGKTPGNEKLHRGFLVNGEFRQDIFAAFIALPIGDDAYQIEFHKYFGDPAEVTATREGFNVEFYDHE